MEKNEKRERRNKIKETRKTIDRIGSKKTGEQIEKKEKEKR